MCNKDVPDPWSLIGISGFCSHECLSEWQEFGSSFTLTKSENNLRPAHYTKGKDTFAWAEQTLTKEACLAIAAFNIHKYNTRDKGQDYEDFGKIIEYANWARSLMEDD